MNALKSKGFVILSSVFTSIYRKKRYFSSSTDDRFSLTFMVLTFLVFSIIAVFAGSLGEKLLQNEKSSKIINLAQGAIFTGIGLKLFFMDR